MACPSEPLGDKSWHVNREAAAKARTGGVAEAATATGRKTDAETEAQIEAGFDNMPI